MRRLDRTDIAIVVMILVGGGGVITASVLAGEKIAGVTSKLENYCRSVRSALDEDAFALDGHLGSAERDRAADRFGEPVALHSYREITLCATAPVDFARHDECYLLRDFACLSAIARAAQEAIPSP